MKKNIAELIGTFTLVFVGTATAVFSGSGILGHGVGMGILAIAFAFGFTLMVLVYTVGPISGCHINPAVTIAMLMAKKIKINNALGYIVAQVIGGILASAVLLVILTGVTGSGKVDSLGNTVGVAQYSVTVHGLGANDVPAFLDIRTTFILEVVLTALFLFVIFNATSSKAQPQAAGLAIGGYLFVAHLIGVPLGDSSLNPARSLGPAILQGGSALGNVWVFIVAPIIGALLGYALFRATAEE